MDAAHAWDSMRFVAIEERRVVLSGMDSVRRQGDHVARGRRGAGRIGRRAIGVTGAVASLLVAVAAAWSPPPAALAQTAAPVTIGDHVVGEGETIAVAVRVNDIEDLYAIDIGLSFDPTVVEVVDTNPGKSGIQSQPGSFLDDGLAVRNEADNDAGTIWYAATQLHPSRPKSGSGALLVVTFRGLKAGVSPLAFTQVAFAERDGDLVPLTTTDGTIRVGVASSTPAAATATDAPTVTPPTRTPTTTTSRGGGGAQRPAPTQPPEPTRAAPDEPDQASAPSATRAPARPGVGSAGDATSMPLRASATPRPAAAEAATASDATDPEGADEAQGAGDESVGSATAEAADAGAPAEDQDHAGAADAAPTWTAAPPSARSGTEGAADASAKSDDGRGPSIGWLLATLVVAVAAFGYFIRRR
jgi:hypothetical protein